MRFRPATLLPAFLAFGQLAALPARAEPETTAGDVGEAASYDPPGGGEPGFESSSPSNRQEKGKQNDKLDQRNGNQTCDAHPRVGLGCHGG